MYTIKITLPAKQDIQSAVSYISNELKNPSAANNLLDNINREVKTLAEMPERYALVKDGYLASKGIRMIQIENYLAFYTVRKEDQTVIVQRFLYGRRDWINILK